MLNPLPFKTGFSEDYRKECDKFVLTKERCYSLDLKHLLKKKSYFLRACYCCVYIFHVDLLNLLKG